MLTAKLKMVGGVREKLSLLASMFKRKCLAVLQKTLWRYIPPRVDCPESQAGTNTPCASLTEVLQAQESCEGMPALARFPLAKSQLPSHSTRGSFISQRHLALPLYDGGILATLAFESCFSGYVPEA